MFLDVLSSQSFSLLSAFAGFLLPAPLNINAVHLRVLNG